MAQRGQRKDVNRGKWLKILSHHLVHWAQRWWWTHQKAWICQNANGGQLLHLPVGFSCTVHCFQSASFAHEHIWYKVATVNFSWIWLSTGNKASTQFRTCQNSVILTLFAHFIVIINVIVVLIRVSSDCVSLCKDKRSHEEEEDEEEESKSQSHDCGVLCVSSVSPNSEWHMGCLLPHSLPPPPSLAGVREGGWENRGRGWISETVQYLRCSIGLLMWDILRMMELRGLTNFGKSEQEEESRGGIWGLLLQPVWSRNLKKKWPKDVVKFRELLLWPPFFFKSNSRGEGIMSS